MLYLAHPNHLECHQMMNFLTKPLKETQHPKKNQGVPHEWLRSSMIYIYNCLDLDGTLLCSAKFGVKKQHLLFHPPLGTAVPFTLESRIHFESLECRVPEVIKFHIRPLFKKAPKQFFKAVPNEWLRSWITYVFGLYSIVLRQFWCETNKQQPLIHLSLGKAVTCEVLTCP